MYTEIQEKNGRKYYYRVRSVRKGKKIKKIKKFLGVNLDKNIIKSRELKADKGLNPINYLLSLEELKALERIKESYIKAPKENFQNRYESFLAQFTYDTNAIEGNTLTLKETSFILFDKLTPQGKSLREINEVLNHKEAFDYILNYKKDIDKKLICKLQGIIVKDTLRKDLENQVGKYRSLQVYIRGANFTPPKPHEVNKEMGSLLRWYSINKKKLHPLITAAYFHSAFESIHPFVDGNGRTGRLLLNFILHKNNYPMVNIQNKRKLKYYECLEEARKGNLRNFVKFLFDIVMSTEIKI